MSAEETKTLVPSEEAPETINVSVIGTALPIVEKDADAAHAEEVAAFLNSFPPEVKKRIIDLQGLQKSHDELEEEFLKEKALLEAKYQKLYEPLYVQRTDIVNGASEGPGGEGEGGSKESKGIPEFWLTALRNSSLIAEQITPRDEGALKHLKDIRWSPLEGGKGFKIDFFFDAASNQYFTNEVLTKTYHMIDEEEPILENAEGTEINWKSGKNLTVKILKRKPAKGSRNAKPITKTEPCESFFNFFSPPAVPEEEDELDDEEAEELQDALEQDYEIGLMLKAKIIPHAVSWFTGEAIDEDAEDEEDDEDDDEGDDELDEDEDEEDDDDDEELEKTPSRKAKKKGGKDGKGVDSKLSQLGAGEQPQECKQQ